MKHLISIVAGLLMAVTAGAATFQNTFTSNAVPQNLQISWQNTNIFPGTIYSYPTNWYTVQNDSITGTNGSRCFTVTNGFFGLPSVNAKPGDEIFIPTNNAGTAINAQFLILQVIDANHVNLYNQATFSAFPNGGPTNLTFQFYPASYAGTDIQGPTNNRWSGALTSEQTFLSITGPDTYQSSFGGGMWFLDVGNTANDCAFHVNVQSINGAPYNGDRFMLWTTLVGPNQPFFIDVNALLACGVLANGTFQCKGVTNSTGALLPIGTGLTTPAIQTTGTATGTITATGFTNTLGTNIYINCIGSAVAVTIKNNAGTAVATNTVGTGGTIIPLQAGGAITAAAGLSGTWWVQ